MATERDAETATDERALMEAYLRGDPEAFRSLYRRHATRLMRLGLSWGLDHSSAEDIVQATFLRVHQNRQRIEGDRPLGPWLVTIALNLVRDRGRKLSRHAAAEAELRSHTADREVHTPHAVAEGKEAADRARRALAALPVAQREAVLAVRVGGLSYPEAAAALDRSEAAVRQNVHRGLRRLLEAMRENIP